MKIKEFPNTKEDPDFIRKNPKARAKDINDAFADKEVKVIIASIGGEDSIRILPFLNTEIIKNNPKIIMGYSDTTTILAYLNKLGIVTFNGPAIMAGFAEQGKLKEEFVNHIKSFFYEDYSIYEYKEYSEWTEQRLEWSDKENLKKTRDFIKNDGWRFLQGEKKKMIGELYGGCIEVLEFLKSTDFWPSKNFWNEKILFFETSEEKPTVNHVKWMLRNYGMQGVFEKISGLLFGRARQYTDSEKKDLDKMIVDIVANEFNRNDLPIISNMDFGHTDPQLVMPLGVKAEIDCENKSFKLVESPFSK